MKKLLLVIISLAMLIPSAYAITCFEICVTDDDCNNGAGSCNSQGQTDCANPDITQPFCATSNPFCDAAGGTECPGNFCICEYELCCYGPGCGPGCAPPECGDGVIDPIGIPGWPGAEQCDDGNEIQGDGCHLCFFEECGNGILNVGEQCDDGNLVSGDGCSNTCEVEECTDCHCGAGDPCEYCCESARDMDMQHNYFDVTCTDSGGQIECDYAYTASNYRTFSVNDCSVPGDIEYTEDGQPSNVITPSCDGSWSFAGDFGQLEDHATEISCPPGGCLYPPITVEQDCNEMTVKLDRAWGTCCTATGTPGCPADPYCEAIVLNFDPLCGIDWSDSCTDLADSLCGYVNGANYDYCDSPPIGVDIDTILFRTSMTDQSQGTCGTPSNACADQGGVCYSAPTNPTLLANFFDNNPCFGGTELGLGTPACTGDYGAGAVCCAPPAEQCVPS